MKDVIHNVCRRSSASNIHDLLLILLLYVADLQDYPSDVDSQHKSSSKSIQDKVKVSANFTYVCLFLFFWTMTAVSLDD